MTATQEQSQQTLQVLIVEDEPRFQDLLLRAIKEMAFEPHAAKSAEEALRLMAASPPPIVIIDLNLPGIPGLQLLEIIRHRWPNTAAIILTGFGDLDAARHAIRLDAVDFLTKPCHLGDLEKSLDRARRRFLQLNTVSNRNESLFHKPINQHPFDTPPAEHENHAINSNPQARKLEEIERAHILASLQRNRGNRSAVALELGISLRTLYYRISEYQQAGYIDDL